MNDYLSLSILEINKLLKEKKIKPIDLVNEVIEKVKASDLNAIITLDLEGAKKRAIELETLEVDNPLFGIPIVIKDNIVTKDLKTRVGSLMLDNFIPCYDATVIEKIKTKKMIIVGKTNMNEFSIGESYYGKTKNPWNKDYFSCGSTSSVSSSLVPLSLGSDLGGELRSSSSLCGLVGMKPTFGRVSRYGLISCANSLEQIGPITKNVYDNALLLEAIAGYDENDATSSKKEPNVSSKLMIEPESKRIAISSFYLEQSINKEVKAKFKEVIEYLKKDDYKIEYIEIPYLEHLISIHKIIMLAELSSNLACFDGIRYGYITKNYQTIEELYVKTRTEGFGKEIKKSIILGTYFLKAENTNDYYYKALGLRKIITDEIKKVFQKYDYFIGPTLLNQSDNSLINGLANLTGIPALTLPIGFDDNDIPIGLQIMSDYFKEAEIYNLAHYLEKSFNLGGVNNAKTNHWN